MEYFDQFFPYVHTVFMYGLNKRFTVEAGGAVSYNKGERAGGVYMWDGSSGTLGGTVEENKAKENGGGVYMADTSGEYGAKFYMSAGVIYGNDSSAGDEKNTANSVAALFIKLYVGDTCKAKYVTFTFDDTGKLTDFTLNGDLDRFCNSAITVTNNGANVTYDPPLGG